MGSALEDIHRAAPWHTIASMLTLPPCPSGGVARGSQPMARFYPTLDKALRDGRLAQATLLSLLRAALAKRLAFETKHDRVVRHAIQERHHQRWIAQVLRPVAKVHVC